MSGTPQLVARLIYGTGMRLLEALRLRVKDLDFGGGGRGPVGEGRQRPDDHAAAGAGQDAPSAVGGSARCTIAMLKKETDACGFRTP